MSHTTPERRPTTVSLPGVFDLEALPQVRDQLAEAVAAGDVTVEASALESTCCNGLFLLLSAAASAREHGTDFAIRDASPPFLSAIALAGLEPAFASSMRG